MCYIFKITVRLLLQQSRVWAPKPTNQRSGQGLKTVEASTTHKGKVCTICSGLLSA